MANETLILDSSRLQRVGKQIGSNPAGIFADQYGQRYYIKTLESAAHARNEWIAACLYQLAGAPTLTYLRTQNPCQIATRWITLDKKHIAHFTEAERQQAWQWLGVHAWTANWDAAGFDGDNQGILAGTVLTLDVGGALAFRAQGDPKGKAFATEVSELDSLRTDSNNPHAVALFAGMGSCQLQQAIMVVTRIGDDQIARTIGDNGGSHTLAEKMIARKVDMTRRL